MHRRSVVSMIALAGTGLSGCASSPNVSPEIQQTLAPTGKLRLAALPGAPASLVREPGTGATRGVAFEISTELARRLHVPLEVLDFGSFSAVVDALTSGRADVAAFNANSARAREVFLSPPLYLVESGYLVPPSSRMQSLIEVDQAGVRVGVQENSTTQATLARLLKNARTVPVANLQTVPELFSRGELDVFATNKPILFDTSDRVPGSRVLPGRFSIERQTIAFPKGRERATPFINEFISEVVRNGLVNQAAQRARLRGFVTE